MHVYVIIAQLLTHLVKLVAMCALAGDARVHSQALECVDVMISMSDIRMPLLPQREGSSQSTPGAMRHLHDAYTLEDRIGGGTKSMSWHRT